LERELTPREIVAELDKYIIGQHAAKKAVAVALRNRYRRSRLPPELRDEVVPKNILMIGPTGVGKTEIARRLAKLVGAPFVKVEATKYTEVGYVGRDVESMVRDLAETAVRMVKDERMESVRARAEAAASDRLLEVLAPMPQDRAAVRNPLEALFGAQPTRQEQEETHSRQREVEAQRRDLARRLQAGELEEMLVEVELEETAAMPLVGALGAQGMEQMGEGLQEMLSSILPRRKRRRRVTVAEARRLLAQEEAARMIDIDSVHAEAILRAEHAGIIFVDEIDKIAGREKGYGPDVSREGVQRDILPIVEGSTVVTKYGPLKTDHVLFIGAGAFHMAKPADLIPELQGRFPIRVELENLTEADFVRILIETENALTKQYTALLRADGVTIAFTEDGIDEIARMAARVNEQAENIGARRLYTVLERLFEDISFEAPDPALTHVSINAGYVREKLSGLVADEDARRFIL
jgi:ATP-dependent HslUV protease ATP-binding subunit HslU